MLLFADQIVSILKHYRMAWIAGKYGGHKTALAFKLASIYGEQGYRIISNAKSIWCDEWADVDLLPDKTLKAVAIMDEAGLELKSKAQFEMFATYSRKMDCIYLMPSFHPPVLSAQVVTIQHMFSFHVIGLPLVVYRWRVKLRAFEEVGSFFWLFPSEVYGVYSTQDPGGQSVELIQFLYEKSQKFRQQFGYQENSLSKVERGSEATFMEAVEELRNTLDDASLLRGTGRKGRR